MRSITARSHYAKLDRRSLQSVLAYGLCGIGVELCVLAALLAATH